MAAHLDLRWVVSPIPFWLQKHAFLGATLLQDDMQVYNSGNDCIWLCDSSRDVVEPHLYNVFFHIALHLNLQFNGVVDTVLSPLLARRWPRLLVIDSA
jgi:hypothetical protein